ncbi:MAG: hypothetical protein AB1424_13190 [Thermodesulfobacteriota bacterium]
MARMEFFIVCEDLSIDQQTNRMSLFNVIEQMMAPNFPLIYSGSAISLWVSEPGDDELDFQCTLRVVFPDGSHRDFPSNFRFRSRRHRVIHRLEGIPINEPGTLRFEVQLNGQYQASHEVDVLKIDLATP